MDLQYVPQARQRDLLGRLLTDWVVFFPAVVEDAVHWRRLQAQDLEATTEGPEWGLSRIRASEPVKAFFFSPRETVASLPLESKSGAAEKRILFGVKGCDLSPLQVHSRMFLEGEFKDPFYEARLANTVLVAADCPEPEETCFCNLVGNKPYATANADIALSVVNSGWLLEPLSDKGRQILEHAGDASEPATEAQVAERQRARQAAEQKLLSINPKPLGEDTPGRIAKRTADTAFWRRHASDCVECHGCLMTCPTCYCFLLYDSARQDGMERTKVWDACYLAAYARVGGGANPRPEFLKRFINRFHCKFMHFKNLHGVYACSGCGRCYRTCMGKIDIRKVLTEA